jgi:hypothetical protein
MQKTKQLEAAEQIETRQQLLGSALQCIRIDDK